MSFNIIDPERNDNQMLIKYEFAIIKRSTINIVKLLIKQEKIQEQNI